MKLEISMIKDTNEGFPDRRSMENSITNPDYTLNCSLCHNESLRIKVSGRRIIIASPMRMYNFPILNLKAFISNIKNKRLKNIDKIIADNGFDGLDYYCRRCDKVYCLNHISTFPVFEEGGWYDYTMASCPERHTWMIDD